MEKHLSVIEILLEQLKKEGKIQYIDEDVAYAQAQKINREMEAYEIEKKQMAIASIEEIAKVIITC